MAFFPAIISETGLVVCPEPDLATFANEDCTGFDEDWHPITVESAVTQGKHLRDCKPSAPLQNECHIGIDYVRPCMEKKRSYRKCLQKPSYDISNPPCTSCPPCGCCPQTSSGRSKSGKRSPTLPNHKQCPLRIMELAAPTKRHCLDTWRSKSHILPDIMVERVRQHVMDEKPLVQIPDALNCFKKRVSNRSSRMCKSTRKISDACMSDMRKFSAIFAYCVAQKLERPLNIDLPPELEKISKVVSYEISMVTKKNNKKADNKSKKNKFENKIQDEMSKKVTAWIDNVLVDTSDKILEDDLRELEEKEGPVLDILDDLIDKILDSFEPPEEVILRETTGDEFVADDESELLTKVYDTEETENINDSKDTNLFKEDITSEMNETDEIINKGDIDVTTDYTDIPLENLHIPPDGFDAPIDGLDIETDDFTGEIANVSETFKKYLEESLDAKNITVKFSDIDKVRGGIGDLKQKQSENIRRILSNSQQNNIKFGPPNEHLLSDADELWPEDIPKVAPKVSAIVSKSITTLGYLDENEEKKFLEQDGDSKKLSKYHVRGSTDKPIDDVKITDNTHNVLRLIEKVEIEVKQTNLSIAKPHDSPGFTIEVDEHLKTAILDPSKLTKDTSLNKDVVITPERKRDYKVDARTAPLWVTTGLCEGGCGEPKDYPENKGQAGEESIACECDQNMGPTGNDVVYTPGQPSCRKKDEYQEIRRELRIWNQNLEIICVNLQIWHDWIEITCKNIRHVKRKSERNRSHRSNVCCQKDIDCWIKLIRYINKDSNFWLKFEHRARTRLKSYKYIYRHKTKSTHNETTIGSNTCICKMICRKRRTD